MPVDTSRWISQAGSDPTSTVPHGSSQDAVELSRTRRTLTSPRATIAQRRGPRPERAGSRPCPSGLLLFSPARDLHRRLTVDERLVAGQVMQDVDVRAIR